LNIPVKDIYTHNMFLSRPRDINLVSEKQEGHEEYLSVDLTMAVSAGPGITHSHGSEVGAAQLADTSSSQTAGYLRNFDMNRLPSGTDEEGGGGSSSAVSTVSPFLSDIVVRYGEKDNGTWDGEVNERTHYQDQGLYNQNTDSLRNIARNCEEDEGDHVSAGGDGSPPPRKKLRLSKEQSALLEESFREHHTLNPKQKNALAKRLNLKSRQVEVWFQNRRARTKLKQTEVDCELLKRCCETLTEENRRLQREVEELRAIKVAPPCVIAQDFYMPLPAATLTMCPSCERVGSSIDMKRGALTFAKPSYYLSNLRQPSAAC
jgi:homeobox-leucine zipper protein